MAPKVSDLVVDSKLDIKVFPLHTIQTVSDSDPTIGRRQTQVEEKWQRTKQLGRGGFGVVWLENCTAGPSSGKLRAVKEIKGGKASPSTIFSRELEAIAKFSHRKYQDHFVRSFGWYDNEESIFITMEYLQHGDLEGYLDATICEAEASVIVRQLLEGLGFMHENKFAHRDLKPSNVLVVRHSPDWWIKIADFGISKRAADDTALRTRVGTTRYLAPEIRGIYSTDLGKDERKTFSLAIDIWAVGAIVVRMVTGKIAFEDDSQLFDYVTRGDPFPILDTISTECFAFIKDTMAASPHHRPASYEVLSHTWLRTNADDGRQSPVVSPSSPPTLSPPLPDLVTFRPSHYFNAYEPLKSNIVDSPALSLPTKESFHVFKYASNNKWNNLQVSRTEILETPSRSIQSLCFCSDGTRLLSVSGSGVFQIWVQDKTGKLQVLHQVISSNRRLIRNLHLSPSGKKFEVRWKAREKHTYNYRQTWRAPSTELQYGKLKLEERMRIVSMTIHWGDANVVAISSNSLLEERKDARSNFSRRLEANSWSLFEIPRLSTIKFTKSYFWSSPESYKNQNFRLMAMCDRSVFAMVCRDDIVGFWLEDEKGEIRLLYEMEVEGVSVIAFSPDGKQLAIGTKSGTMQIWKLDDV